MAVHEGPNLVDHEGPTDTAICLWPMRVAAWRTMRVSYYSMALSYSDHEGLVFYEYTTAIWLWSMRDLPMRVCYITVFSWVYDMLMLCWSPSANYSKLCKGHKFVCMGAILSSMGFQRTVILIFPCHYQGNHLI